MAALKATVRAATLTINATQLDALNGTPLTIVPAPGAGRVVKPLFCAAHLTRGTTAWSAASTVVIRWNGDTTNLVQALSFPFNATNGTALDRFLFMLVGSSYTGANNFSPANRALEVTLTADINSGAADTVLKLFLVYETDTGLF